MNLLRTTRIYFAQLLGMSDHISFNLANEKFNVAKYVPFGPIKEVMPYLLRRADENTSVAGQTGRELGLIKAELRSRKLIENFSSLKISCSISKGKLHLDKE